MGSAALLQSLASTANASPYTTASFTPNEGDCLVVFYYVSGGAANIPSFADSTGEVTFAQAASTTRNSGGNSCGVFIGLRPCMSARSRTIQLTSAGTLTGCFIFVFAIRGTGGANWRQMWSGLSTPSTPVIGFGAVNAGNEPAIAQNMLVDSVVVGACFQTAVAVTISPPTNYTEDNDTTYATPSSSGECIHRDSGETGNTLTWGSAASGNYAAFAVEFYGQPPQLPNPPRGSLPMLHVPYRDQRMKQAGR